MKRVLLVAMAAVLLLAPAANAQSVNEGAVRAKLEKSNADIANPKKNAKAATWLNRGKVYFESLQAPTKNLFMDLLDQAMLPTNMGGEPKSTLPEVQFLYSPNVSNYQHTYPIISDKYSPVKIEYPPNYPCSPYQQDLKF